MTVILMFAKFFKSIFILIYKTLLLFSTDGIKARLLLFHYSLLIFKKRICSNGNPSEKPESLVSSFNYEIAFPSQVIVMAIFYEK